MACAVCCICVCNALHAESAEVHMTRASGDGLHALYAAGDGSRALCTRNC